MLTNGLDVEKSFVYLKNIDPTIQIDLRYFGEENFVGAPIRGYKKQIAVLTKDCAHALKKAQKYFNKLGYSIVLYDAYRPTDAVDHFWKWAQDVSDQKMKATYYPRVNKEEAFNLGYISRKSGHSRGSTVDISILPKENIIHSPKQEFREINGFKFLYLNDGTLDMGGAFDMFDEISHVITEGLTKEQQSNRNLLQKGMNQSGFNSYKNEWWHFTLRDEPYPDTYFNFSVI